MSKLNAEGHDGSQYLPRGTPPVNAFRAQHGNVRWEGEAIKALTWLPDILFERKIIEECHLHTANSFLRVLIHAKRTLGITDLRGALFDKFPDSMPTENDLFLEICRELPRPEANAIIWLVWDDYNRRNIALASVSCLFPSQA